MSKNVATLFNVVIVVVLAIAVAGLWEGAEAKAMPSEGERLMILATFLAVI